MVESVLRVGYIAPMANKPLTVYVVLDSRGQLVGTFRKESDAQAAADRHDYVARVIPQAVK